ncbi:MAG: hypothetical protein ACRDRI_17550 [Pseudonocardiaceae bacterium]
MTVLDARALPLGITACGPDRWIVRPGAGFAAPLRSPAVLSVAWLAVAGCGR